MTVHDDSEDRTQVVTRDVVEKRSGQPFRLGRYRLDKLIGQGGMAEVYLAFADGPAATRAVVKRIRPSLLSHAASQTLVEMFLREARLLASLDHPNIVRIYELGIEPPRNGNAFGEHFLAMEHLEGLTLHDLALRVWQMQKPLPIEVLVRVVADLCVGLDHAHHMKDPATGKAAGLVHRDISPDNVFVTTSGVTKLLDFGVAKRQGWTALTTAGELRGKVPFMAPEQLKEEPVDGRADVFAVGVVFYWLLTGRRPFDGPSDVFTMKAILDDPPQRLRALNPNVPARLEEIVLSCLAKNPAGRTASASALRDALLAALPSEAPLPVADVIVAAMGLPPTDKETPVAVASITRTSWERAPVPVTAAPIAEPEEPQTQVNAPVPLFEDELTRIGSRPMGPPASSPSPSPSPPRPPRMATRLSPADLSADVQRLEDEVGRLEAKLTALSAAQAPVAGLIGAVGPLLWGLEQAITHLSTLSSDPATANHLRQLKILQAVLKRLVDATALH